jgi:DNA-binding response OmpR family regulator
MFTLPTSYEESVGARRGIDLDAFVGKASMQRALIVDDDPDTVDLIKIVIRNAGMDVVGAFSGNEALEKCSDLHPNIILLDLMMPGMDGWETYNRLRKLTDVPVIVVSADTKKENVVRGLNSGFDDYVTKPFFPPELVARVNVVLRRVGQSKPITARVFSAIGLVVDYETHDVMIHDKAVQLPREFAILAALAKRAPDGMVRRDCHRYLG